MNNLKARVLLTLPITPFRDNFRVANDTPREYRANGILVAE